MIPETFTKMFNQVSSAKRNGKGQLKAAEKAPGTKALSIREFNWKKGRTWLSIFNQYIVYFDFSQEAITELHYTNQLQNYIPTRIYVHRQVPDKEEELKAFLNNRLKAIKEKHPRVWVSLQHPAIQTISITLPHIGQEIDIATALPLQIKSEFPDFDDERYYWQSYPAGIIEIDELTHMVFLVALMPREIINYYVKIFSSIGFEAEFILPRNFALLTGINNVVANMPHALLVEIGKTNSTIVSYKAGIPMEVFELPVGVEAIKDHRVRYEIPYEEEAMEESFLKKRLENKGYTKMKRENAHLLPLVFELNKIQYWLTQKYGVQSIDVLLINFREQPQGNEYSNLQQFFQFPVLPVVCARPIAGEESAPSFVAIGIHQYILNNPQLVPSDILWEVRYKKINVGLSVFFLLFLGILGVHYSQQKKQIYQLQHQVNALQSSVIQMGEKNETLKNLLIVKSNLTQEVSRLKQLLTNDSPLLSLLYTTTQKLPASLIADEIVIDDSQNPQFLEYTSYVSQESWKVGVLLKGHSFLPVIRAESDLLTYINQLKKQSIFKEIIPVHRNFNVSQKRYEFILLMVVR